MAPRSSSRPRSPLDPSQESRSAAADDHPVDGATSAHSRHALMASLLVLGAAALFSTGGAAVKACSLDAWQVASFRSGIAAVALAVLLPRSIRALSWRSFLVGVSYAATLILYVNANKLTTSANAIFLQSTAPLYVLILGPWLLSERVRRSDVGAMALIAVGLSAFFVEVDPATASAPDPLRGNLLGVSAGVTWALTLVGLRWLGRQAAEPEIASRSSGDKAPNDRRKGGDPALAAVVAGNLIAFIACLPAALPVASSTTADWWVIVYLGVVQIGIAYALLTAGMARLRALEVSLLVMAEPVLNPLWAWLIHQEVPGRWAIAGGVLILLATVGLSLLGAMRNVSESRARRRAAPPAV